MRCYSRSRDGHPRRPGELPAAPACFLGCSLFLVLLATALVVSPLTLIVAAALLAPAVLAALLSRSARHRPAPAPPGGRRP